MKKKTVIHYELELLPSSIFIFFNYKEKDKAEIYNILQNTLITATRALALIKKIDDVNLDEDRGLSFESGPVQVIILREFDIRNTESLTLLNHEMTHLVYGIGNYIGATFSNDSEEFYTNIQEYLTNKILKDYKNNVRNNNKQH